MATKKRATKKTMAPKRATPKRPKPRPKKKPAPPQPSKESRALGKRLALARSYTENGSGLPISARELSRLAGLVPTHVWALEALGRPGVTVDTVSRLARVLGVSLDWLYHGEGAAPTRSLVVRSVMKAQVRHARKLRREAA